MAVFLLVFLSTLPVAIPFLVMHGAVPALRVSNAVAGVAYGRDAGRKGMAVGLRQIDMREAYPDVDVIAPAPKGETL